MLNRLAVAALLCTLLFPPAVLAQEFASASGGQIDVLTKGTKSRFGSLSLRSGNLLTGYDASLGGTLLDDRVWFFGSATMTEGISTRFAPVADSSLETIDAKLTAQLGSRQDLAATFSNRSLEAPAYFTTALPSSFLSLRYDAMLSSNAMFSARVSKSSTRVPIP